MLCGEYGTRCKKNWAEMSFFLERKCFVVFKIFTYRMFCSFVYRMFCSFTRLENNQDPTKCFVVNRAAAKKSQNYKTLQNKNQSIHKGSLCLRIHGDTEQV